MGGVPLLQQDIEKILSSVGVYCDADLAGKVVSQLDGKDLKVVIAEGMEKVGSMPAGGGGGGAAPAAAGGDAPAAAVEEKKEEEPEEESDDDMGFGLFD